MIALSDAGHFETVERLAGKGVSRSCIFDGLIMTAAKSGASAIYTWDVDDFHSVAPERATKRIRTL